MTWFSGLQYCSWTAALMDAYIASLDIYVVGIFKRVVMFFIFIAVVLVGIYNQ